MKGWDSVIEKKAQEECIVMSVLIPRRPVLLFLLKKKNTICRPAGLL